MAADTTGKGKPWIRTERSAPATSQGKAYSASMADKTRVEIEKAAYYRWLNRGCPGGDDWADWLLAEKEYKSKK